MLLQKPRAYAEVYNDLDTEVVNLFRVARDPVMGEQLAQVLELTPFARDEFVLSFDRTFDPVEQARRTIARSFMSFSSAGATRQPSGFRANLNRSHTTPAHDWVNYPDALRRVIQRLRGVVIENRDALDVISQHDSPDTLFYLDPPYVHSTRYLAGKKHAYMYEMDDVQHRRMAQLVTDLSGYVVVSGYDCDLYREVFGGWRVVRRKAHADGAAQRTECLWLSPNMPAPGLNFEDAA